MKRILVAAAAVLLIAAAGAFGQAFKADYLDGTVELKSGTAWKGLSIGDTVAADATVRVSQGGTLELVRGTLRLSIVKDGTYEVAALAKAAGASTTSAGLGVTTKLKTVVAGASSTGSSGNTAGGVRAADATAAKVPPMDDGSEADRMEIQGYLSAAKYAAALSLIEEDLGLISSGIYAKSLANELYYYQGVAYYGSGLGARAFRSLSKVVPDMAAEWYASYVILQSQVLVDTQNYRDALAVLAPFVAAYPAGEPTQMAYLMTFYAQKGLGDMAAAKAALETGYKLDTATEAAKLIDAQRKTLK